MKAMLQLMKADLVEVELHEKEHEGFPYRTAVVNIICEDGSTYSIEAVGGPNLVIEVVEEQAEDLGDPDDTGDPDDR